MLLADHQCRSNAKLDILYLRLRKIPAILGRRSRNLYMALLLAPGNPSQVSLINQKSIITKEISIDVNLKFDYGKVKFLPGIDFPNSKYSCTEGLKNPGGIVLCGLRLFLSSC